MALDKIPDSEEETSPEDMPIKESIERDPVFYYSRERRLSHASPLVRQLNEGGPVRGGFTRGIFAAKGNLFIFGALMLALSVFGLAHRFSNSDRGIAIGGNAISMSIVKEEGVLLLNIEKRAPRSGKSFSGPVDIAVSPVLPKNIDGYPDDIPPVFTHRIIFHQVQTESSSVTLPFSEEEFLIILWANDEQKTLKVKIK